jgi:RHS repeat-associated protein
LSQVLSDGTDTYVYGHARLRALGGPWYVGDALGSVRQTLDDAGGVLGSMQYDPWGVPTAGTPQPFGFTGELHHQGQVYLRARWYAPGQGRFVSENPFAGFPEMPYSLHAYQYGYSDPIYKTDPSGLCVPEYRRLVTFRGRQYLVTGGDPGCKPVWDIGQGLNWKDWGDYNWAVFEGMGSPGAWVIDQFCGTNEFERIWSDPSRGHVSGAAFGVAAVGAGLFKYIVSPLARHIAAGGTGVETVRQNAENLSRSAEAIDGVITQGTSSAPAMPSGADPYTELSQKFIEIATSDPKINCWNCTLKTFGYEDIENVEELYRILDQNFVPTSSPRPGDLVLWEMEPLPLEPGEPTLRRPFHMALYAGDDSGGQYLSYSLTSGGKKSTEPAGVYTLSELAEINEAIKTYTPQYYRLQP